MPRCVLLAEYAFGILRLQEKSACLVLVDGHAFIYGPAGHMGVSLERPNLRIRP